MNITEEDLIAYHLGELTPLRRRAVQSALERDNALAAESAEIAETLRAFSAPPAPIVDAAVSDRMWQSIRPSLLVIEPAPKHPRWRWAFGFASGIAVCILATLLFTHHASSHNEGTPNEVADNSAPQQSVAPRTDETPLIQELHASQQPQQTKNAHYNNRPGPLTTMPVEEAGFTRHLGNAERLLTQVNHQDGPLPAETRQQVHHLLLENAVYQQRAQVRGDYATANVMDDLGRVLVTLDAAPPQDAQAADAFRLQMNVGNVLFDLRILHHNKLQER